MKKLTITLILPLMLMTTAMAKITFVVPKARAGTIVWTEIVTKELQKYLDDDIVHYDDSMSERHTGSNKSQCLISIKKIT